MKRRIMLTVIVCATVIVRVLGVPPREFLEDQIAEESIDHEEYYPSFAMPKLFNDGKPFIVNKDPITGTIDFNTKKTVTSTTNYKESESHRPSDINQIAPNIHDFLNLPVKYSSAKSVYPLISSSYSNLKYQGNNKHFISNHKNYTAFTTTAPKYYTNTVFAKSTVETKSTTVLTKPTTTPTTTITTTTPKPTTTTPKPSTTPSTTVATTPSSTTTFKFDTKFKYQDSAQIRKKVNITTTTTPKPSKVAFPTYNKLNVIPLKSSPAPSSTNSPTRPTLSYLDSSKVRFPSSTSTRTPTPTSKTPTKKVPSLSDLFSLWSNGDDDYEDETEKNTVLPTVAESPKITFVDAPDSMLPNGFGSTPSTQLTSTHQTIFSQTPKVSQTPKPTSTSTPTSTAKTETSTSTRITTKAPEVIRRETEPPKTEPTKRVTVSVEPSPSPTKIHYTTPNIIKQSPIPVVRPSPESKPFEIFKSTDLSQPDSGSVWKFPDAQASTSPEMKPTRPHLSSESSEILKTSDGPDKRYPEMQQFLPQAPVRRPVYADNAISPTSHEQNYVSFGGMGGMPVRNTFVISPGQDSASFVLGSQSVVTGSQKGQFVGSASQGSFDGKVPGQVINEGQVLSERPDGHFGMKVQGQVINEAPGSAPQGFKLHNTAPVRFPISENEIPAGGIENPQIVRGTISAQPLSGNMDMSPQQMNSELAKNPEMVVFKEEGYTDKVQPPPLDLTPPGDGQYEAPQFFERPGPNNPYIYGRPNRPAQRLDRRPPQFQRLPLNERPQGNRIQRPQLQYRIDHIPMPTKINRNQDRLMMTDRSEDRNQLPNILPQFRPNVRLIPNGQKVRYQDWPRPQQTPPAFVRRPPQMVLRDEYQRPFPEYSNPTNRRHYMTAPYPPGLTPPQKFLDPSHPVFQRHINVNTSPLFQAPQPPQEGVPQIFRDHEARNDKTRETEIPTPPFMTQELKKEPKLEPVVTLQQLQSKRLKELREKEQQTVELPKLKETVPEVPVTVETVSPVNPNPVYVVYPVKGQEESDLGPLENGIVIASRGEQGVAPPVTSGHEYQNTPFSVVSHFEQEPILTVVKDKNKKGSSFPYTLEKPDNIPGNHRPDPVYNTGEQPQVISSTLHRVTTGRPIAIAYTPSPRPIDPKGPLIYDSTNHEVYSMPNVAAQVITEIRDEATENNLFVDDYDNDRVRESFQAPFYASVNLPNKVTPTSVHEGWAIVTPGEGPHRHFETNQIDRADKNVEETIADRRGEVEVTTKKFDPDSFKPEFLSGFQPIYSSPTAAKPSPLPTVRSRDTVVAEKAKVEVTSPTTARPKTPKPTAEKPKKPRPFDSLEAFFDALTRDYDAHEDEDYESTSKSS